jgi:hypothetical protein
MGIIGGSTRRHHEQKALRPLAIAVLTLMLAATAIAQAGKVDFKVLPVPRSLGLSNGHSNFVIRSAQEWNAWVDKLTDVVEPLPTIDFEHYTLLVVNAGYKTQGPLIVKFDSVTDEANEVRVHVSVTGPASCPQVPEPGHYAAMALIPRSDKPVQFDVSNTASDCRHQ